MIGHFLQVVPPPGHFIPGQFFTHIIISPEQFYRTSAPPNLCQLSATAHGLLVMLPQFLRPSFEFSLPKCVLYVPLAALRYSPAEGMKIHTRCSAIAERPRCRVRYSFRQK